MTEPGLPRHLPETTDSRQLNLVLLQQLTEVALRPDTQFGRDLNLTAEERDQLMTVVGKANEVLAPRYEDPTWKHFVGITGYESSSRTFDNHEGTRVPSWCIDNGPNAAMHPVSYYDQDARPLKGLSVPTHIFQLVHLTNTVRDLQAYAVDAHTIPFGYPAEDMGMAVRDLTQLLAVQPKTEPAEEPAPASTVDPTDHEQEPIPREPTNMLGLDSSRLKAFAEEVHQNGMSSDQLRHVYDNNLRRHNPLATELVYRVGERIGQEWEGPARSSFNRGFTLGHHLIDYASAEGAPKLSLDALSEVSEYQKGLELADLQEAADALLRSQVTLNEAFNQALLGLPEGTDTFVARMGGGVALLGELIAQEDNNNGSL
jgi:hypothetical protein